MFSREEARTRLDAFKVPDWRERQQARIDSLPKPLRDAAAAIFSRRGYVVAYWFESDLGVWRQLSQSERRRIFESAAPGKADVLERTWQIADRLPYPVGIARRPFRAPDRPEVYLRRRAQAVRQAASVLAAYQGDIPWFAAWSSHMWGDIGVMLAAEIEHGPDGDETLSTLLEIVNGTHPFAAVSRSAIRALLVCDRAEAWEAVERLVLAAQRQEGIRQVVFEAADEVHPEAFKRLLRLVVDERLTRFASVVRAFGVWLGLEADVIERKEIDRVLALVVDAIADPNIAAAAVASADPDTVYAGLWSHAYNDAAGATTSAVRLIHGENLEIRFAATHLLAQLELPESRAELRRLLQDPDRTIAARAFSGLASGPIEPDAYDDLESYLERLEKDRKLDPPIWGWLRLAESPSAVVQRMLEIRGDRHPAAVHHHLAKMNADARSRYVRELVAAPMTAEGRRALVDLAADRSQWVTNTVFKALADTGISSEEAPVFEGLLTRKTGAIRSAAIAALATQKDRGALESARRLLGSGKVEQRVGGLELLRGLKEANRATDAVAAIAAEYRSERRKPGSEERKMLEHLAAAESAEVTLDDGLGLFDPAELAGVMAPKKRRVKVSTPSHQKLLASADALVEQYREAPIAMSTWAGDEERLYGSQYWGLDPKRGQVADEAPLADVWRDWWQRQDAPPFDLERCLVAAGQDEWRHHKSIGRKGLPARPALDYPRQVFAALWWIWLEHGDAEGLEFLIDGYESALAMVPRGELVDPMVASRRWDGQKTDWREHSPAVAWNRPITTALALRPDLSDERLFGRLWRLASWLDRPKPNVPRHRASFELLLEARKLGLANQADLIDHLVGPRSELGHGYGRRGFDALRQVTRRRPPDDLAADTELLAAADLVRRRVLEVELERGDVATPASSPALAIRSIAGADRTVALLSASGRGTFQRGWSWHAEQKNGVLSHLIRVSHPAENDTPVGFAELAVAAGVTEKRLLEFAVYAPQWSRHVEHTLGWEGLEDAVYWLHAHTKDTRWSVDVDLRAEWAAEIAGRTQLSSADLLDGGVDVEWFHRVLDTLGTKRWEQLLAHAKFASGGGGHKRAEMFGEALRGALSFEALAERIRAKRHQDSVRAVGLIPLGGNVGEKADAVLERYQLFQDFRRGSRKFGSQKQASEKRAVEIGLDNLARTAGYADPIRLQWEMETQEAGDLATGPISLVKDDYTLQLAIDRLGQAELTVTKAGKKLKSVPAKLRKDDDVVALRSRATQLRRQVSRVRSSLEAAAVSGDAFTGEELARLHDHPVLRPMLAAALFILPDGTIGLPTDDGASLRPISGRMRKIGNHPVRLAHPVDLLASDQWSEWQHQCFVDEIEQPFKQVFRELYVLTAAETADGKKSVRYAGHQVNPRQAAGLFGSRGWISHPDGYTFKAFHKDDLMATMFFDGALFSPAEVDGATLYGLTFQRRDAQELLDLEAVPPRLFSEVMRDLDLVVSVAHIGGVDPEASASTVEMRTALVRETAMLLSLDNVRFAGPHVMVDGKLGNYSIHLGSGMVHRQPGGSVCIIPVGSQHRGRLFLPFADDDPKTAEIVAKTLLLAKDDQIKDPTILEQIV